jgi:hypothetical protein
MRWLLLKDLQILRRSKLLVALLVIYPVAIALLIGFAISGGPEKPKVAFVNLVPKGKTEFTLGGERLDATRYSDELFKSVDPIRVSTRAEAIEKVESGAALGALIVPADVTERLQRMIDLSGGPPPTLEVIYNAEDPVKRRFVESTIESRLAEANQLLSQRLTAIAADYLDIIVAGGRFSLLGRSFEVLGLRRSLTIIEATMRRLPEDSPERTALAQVARFSRLASENLDVSKPILASIGAPVRVKQRVIDGSRSPLDAFAVAVAVTVSLMFVTLLLAAGMLALEREENAFGRVLVGGGARHARGHRAVHRRRLGAGAAVAAGAGARGARLRGHGGGDRRAGPGGARRVAAGVPAVPPDRVPGARAVGLGERLAVRSDLGRIGAVPVQAGAARPRRGHQRRRPRGEPPAPRGVDGGLRRAGAIVAPSLRVTGDHYPAPTCPSPPRGCAGCARPASCARWSVRPS